MERGRQHTDSGPSPPRSAGRRLTPIHSFPSDVPASATLPIDQPVPPSKLHRSAKRLITSLACVATLAGLATGQEFDRVRPPVGLQGSLLDPPPPARPGDALPVRDPRVDPGIPVEILESPNIDRYLRRAQDFLARDDYAGAIKILQVVVEGRTLAELPDGEPAAESRSDATQPDSPGAATPAGGGADGGRQFQRLLEEAENAVFSSDGRLYHPVHRLCHDLLASLPVEGRRWYRTRFEVEAEQALEVALAGRDPLALEEVYERWFLTHAAGEALLARGELLMDQGRGRAAIDVFRKLLDPYPAEARRELGIDDATLRFRIAVCFALIGDGAEVHEGLWMIRSVYSGFPSAPML